MINHKLILGMFVVLIKCGLTGKLSYAVERTGTAVNILGSWRVLRAEKDLLLNIERSYIKRSAKFQSTSKIEIKENANP